jgi:hypothetical protein
MDLEELFSHLQCPDDSGALHRRERGLCCADCGRVFPEIGPGVFDLLPLKANPQALECLCVAHKEAYLKEFQRSLRLADTSLAWGAPEATPDKWANRKRRQVEWLLPLVSAGNPAQELVLCDLSAGSGYYTLRFAAEFKYVLHCDLSPASITYTKRRADETGVKNILFCRVDYFSLPIRSVDRVICMDTLIRGAQHEEILMNAIVSALSPIGVGGVDFHNWWHNPIRRMGLLPQNFPNNGVYSKREAHSIVGRSGLGQCEYFRYDESCGNPASLTRFLRWMLPPSRHTFRVAP